MPKLAVINQSTVTSDVDVGHMVDALNVLLPIFCSDWSLSQTTAHFIPRPVHGTAHGASLPALGISYVLSIIDYDPSAVGILGWHDEVAGISFARILAKTILDNSGASLYGGPNVPTVAQCLSHEAFELLCDVRCNTWWENKNTNILVASEVCDACEGAIVPVTVHGIIVGMSDWILPKWTDIEATTGPFNHLNTMTHAFEMQPNGYWIQMVAGVVSQQFAEQVPEWKRVQKLTATRHVIRGVGRSDSAST